MKGFTGKYISWTETARLQLVEAVVQVEEEIESESNHASRAPSGKERGNSDWVADSVAKWERVASLLPPELQGKVWNRRDNRFEDRRKCASIFDDLLRCYKEKLAGMNTKYSRRKITKPVLKMLKRREDLLKSRTSIQAENKGHASESLSVGTATERAAILLLEQVKASESAGDALRFDCVHAEEIEKIHNIDQENTCKRRNPANLKQPKSCTVGSGSRSMKECKEPHDTGKAKIQVQAGARSRRQERDPKSSARRPANFSRASRFENELNASISLTSNDDDLQPILNGLLRRQELELCRLSSWVHSRSTPVWRRAMKKMTSSAMRSSKRRKLDVGRATEPYDERIQESLSRMLDLRIRASFQKMRFRISQVVESTYMELAQELLQDFPSSSLPVSGGQRHSEEGQT